MEGRAQIGISTAMASVQQNGLAKVSFWVQWSGLEFTCEVEAAVLEALNKKH